MSGEKRNELIGLINAIADVQKHVLGLLFGGIPEEVRRHMRNARKEKLLALRACIDQAIARLEEAEEKKEAKEVEVE